ncbi:MAG TPA: hypothetical protein VF535_16720 [Allosphingosinicella sp.]|jgi:hypothetical protein
MVKRTVPRFFFHVFDDVVIHDDDGLELADAEAARRAALAGARSLICDQVKEGRLKLHHRIEVEDEAGVEILALRFGDAIEIETDRL